MTAANLCQGPASGPVVQWWRSRLLSHFPPPPPPPPSPPPSSPPPPPPQYFGVLRGRPWLEAAPVSSPHGVHAQ
ncbi:hypothetical protein E2C01_102725 [Portunus trituberculatus]|uniref:Uncharacterized protein n=1 Tax=Portunus trituberculatus TaxID=210409 RepID=A0A5B7KE05_PORTR|nr:hypothetical protein [Portunus trituberculatus]